MAANSVTYYAAVNITVGGRPFKEGDLLEGVRASTIQTMLEQGQANAVEAKPAGEPAKTKETTPPPKAAKTK